MPFEYPGPFTAWPQPSFPAHLCFPSALPAPPLYFLLPLLLPQHTVNFDASIFVLTGASACIGHSSLPGKSPCIPAPLKC